MGRYLANGILTGFYVKRKNKSFDLEGKIEEILGGMNKFIDTNLYKLVYKDEDYFEYHLDASFVEKHIYELLSELSSLTEPESFDFVDDNRKINYTDERFMKDHPIKCKEEEDKNKIFYIEYDDGNRISENYSFYPFYWLTNNLGLYSDIEIDGPIINMWMDFNKYDSEDETPMLEIINSMKATYYKSSLSKALIYYIFG